MSTFSDISLAIIGAAVLILGLPTIGYHYLYGRYQVSYNEDLREVEREFTIRDEKIVFFVRNDTSDYYTDISARFRFYDQKGLIIKSGDEIEEIDITIGNLRPNESLTKISEERVPPGTNSVELVAGLITKVGR